MTPKLFSFALIFFVFIFLFGCKEDPLLTPQNKSIEPKSNGLILKESQITLDVFFKNDISQPYLKMKAKLGLANEGNKVTIGDIIVKLQDNSSYYNFFYFAIDEADKKTFEFTQTMKGPCPFSECQIINISIFYRSDSANQSISHVLEISREVWVNWNGKTEPNLRDMNLQGYINVIHGIIWEHSNKGFYFHGGGGTISREIYYCDFKISSIDKIPIRLAYGYLHDITKDDKFLLISDTSTLFLYNIETFDKEVLFSSKDQLWIHSSKFSDDDELLVFSVYSPSSINTKNQIFLYSIRDKTFKKIEYSTSVIGGGIAGWFPNSKDILLFNSYSSIYSTYSISQNKVTNYYYPSYYYGWKLLTDGTTLLSLYPVRIANGIQEENHIFSHNLGGKLIQQLTYYPETIFQFAASPDLKHLAFTGYRNHKWGLWTIPLEK